MKIRLAAELQTDSIVDGEGIRTVIWTQGCPHNCLECHNQITHDFKGGCLIDIEEIKTKISKLSNQNGITFSGGDPMCQPGPCYELAKYIKSLSLNVWCYTGYTYEQLISMKNEKVMKFLSQIDVLIDGKFLIEEKSMDAIFRGSKNQRIIDVQRSLKEQKVVLVEKYVPKEKKEIFQFGHEEYLYV